MVESLSTARIPDGTPLGLAQAGLRFAYADPPYPGQSKRLYGNHPDYAGEVDHAELVERLCRDYPDGWALSTHNKGLQHVLACCPPDVEVAIWHVLNAPPPGAMKDRYHRAWEAVIIRGGRLGGPAVRNLLACGSLTGGCAIQENHSIPGQKPSRFTRWVAELLGATPDDQIDDLFPGSGAVGLTLARFAMQPMLEQISEPQAAAQESLL